MDLKTFKVTFSELSDEDFHILYTSVRDGKNYAPRSRASLYLFIESFLREVGEEVDTFQGRISRREYAELLRDLRKHLQPLMKKIEKSPYKAILNLLPKDVVAFNFFLKQIFPYLIASGASPSTVEKLVLYLFSLPKKTYFKVLRFLARYVKRYGSPSLALIFMLIKNIDWERWKDG